MVRVSKFYKDAKNGRYLRYLHEDTRTLYETFRRGVKESSKSIYVLYTSSNKCFYLISLEANPTPVIMCLQRHHIACSRGFSIHTQLRGRECPKALF